MEIQTISPKELAARKQAGEEIELLDVRTPLEFREVHCEFARNLPLSDLDPPSYWKSRTSPSDRPLYLICRSGSRGKQACEKFLAAGLTNVINVEGGTLAWADCGLPVNRGKKAISLERQVRIVVGTLIIIGAALGYFVYPALVAIPAMMGLGLLYSGITDSCAMGLMLARMPWNRVSTVTCAK